MTTQPSDAIPTPVILHFSESMTRSVFDAMSAHIAILDHDGVIPGHQPCLAGPCRAQGGLPPEYDYRGINYLSDCDATGGDDSQDACNVASGNPGCHRQAAR